MKAVLGPHLIAESDDVIEHDGYHYFPRAAVRLAWLSAAPKNESDLACPHGVQFYDAVIDGRRHERVAWSYEAPRASMAHIGHRFGFWNGVTVA